MYPDRPSRYTCIWLCNKKGINNWIKLLNADKTGYQIYKVETAREPFVTNEKNLPFAYQPRELMYKQAEEYWNPKNIDFRTNGNEFLCEGKVKLLERVK